MQQLEGRINNQILVFETYQRDFLWTKCPRTISCHKTTVARLFLFQWGWNFNLFLWFWHPWCSLGWSFLTNIFFSFFRVSVFFGLGFESLTAVSGTVAAFAASLQAGVVFGTYWKVHGYNLKWIKVTCISNILTAKSCPHKARVVPNRNVDSERHCCFEKWRQSGNIFLDCQS